MTGARATVVGPWPESGPRSASGRGLVLVVDHHESTLRDVEDLLRGHGYRTLSARDASGAVDLARAMAPDVVIVAAELPDGDGTEVCRAIRTFSDAYVVVVTARRDELTTVVALKVGADDVVVAPFPGSELLARIEALLRRPRSMATEDTSRRELGDLVVDVDRRRVTVAGSEVQLTRSEFAVLAALTESPGRVVERDELCVRAGRRGWPTSDHALEVHVGNLRRKLDPAGPSRIRTVRGVGYQLLEPALEPV